MKHLFELEAQREDHEHFTFDKKFDNFQLLRKHKIQPYQSFVLRSHLRQDSFIFLTVTVTVTNTVTVTAESGQIIEFLKGGIRIKKKQN